MSFWRKSRREQREDWIRHGHLQDQVLVLKGQIETLGRDLETERTNSHEAVMGIARAMDEATAKIAQIESRSARSDQGHVKEWLPVLARMQEVTLAAMGHADMAQQFGLTDRQQEASTDTPSPWVDMGPEGGEEDDRDSDGMTYG